MSVRIWLAFAIVFWPCEMPRFYRLMHINFEHVAAAAAHQPLLTRKQKKKTAKRWRNNREKYKYCKKTNDCYLIIVNNKKQKKTFTRLLCLVVASCTPHMCIKYVYWSSTVCCCVFWLLWLRDHFFSFQLRMHEFVFGNCESNLIS